MKKRLIMILVIASFFTFFTLQAFANSQLNEAISWMHENGLTKFNNAQDFMSDKSLRRDEAAKFFVQYAKETLWNVADTSKSNCDFMDLNEARPDLKGLIKESCQLWLFQWSHGNFMPTQPLTNAQAITVLIRMIDWKKDETEGHFAQKYFEKAEDINIMEWLYLSDSDHFDQLATRWEVWILIFNSAHMNDSNHTDTIIDQEEARETIINWEWTTISEAIYFKKWLHKFKLSHNWESNFIVNLIDNKWDYVNWLSNEIGNSESSIGINIPTDWDYFVNIKADWTWQVVINYETERVDIKDKITGKWSEIIWPFMLSEWLHKFELSHVWESNFIVNLIDENWSFVNLLSNEIGNADISLGVWTEKGDYYLNINADGNWEIQEF